MRLQYFVNTMALIEGANSRILCDPWVTFDNESTCDFYNFPPTRLTRGEVAGIKPDFIYLTHSHPDHFDPITLDLFPRTTPILIARFQNPFFAGAIRRLGFTDIRIMDPDQGLPLNGQDRCWIWPADTYPDVDSVALFKVDGMTIVNLNDNPFHAGQCGRIRAKFGAIDVGLLPFSAHGPYPMFYENLSDAEKATKAAERKLRAYAAFASQIEALSVRFAVPFAGGLMAAGPKALRYVYSGIGTRSEAVEHARRQCEFTPILLSEGNIYDFDKQEREGTYIETTYEREQGYLNYVAGQPTRFDLGGRFHVDESEQIDLTYLLRQAREKQRKWQEIKGVNSDAVYFLDLGQPMLYRLCLADGDVARVRETEIADAKYEIFRMPYALLLGLLTRHYNWSNVKTQYMWYCRKPDVFDPGLHLMMSFLHL